MQKRFDTLKESLETRNVSKYFELNRPWLRSLPIVFRTWLSTQRSLLSLRSQELASKITGFHSTIF